MNKPTLNPGSTHEAIKKYILVIFVVQFVSNKAVTYEGKKFATEFMKGRKREIIAKWTDWND